MIFYCVEGYSKEKRKGDAERGETMEGRRQGKGGDFQVDVELETPAEIRGNAKAATKVEE